jgi:hypothetical protein
MSNSTVRLARFLSSINPLRNYRAFVVAKKRKLAGYSSVYHVHIMKTGGTSLNNMFLNLSDPIEIKNKYHALMDATDLRLILKDWVYIAWNNWLVKWPFWNYAWSHSPFYKVRLPKGTFIITCIRNPEKRLYSRYKHLVTNFNRGRPLRPNKIEYEYLGNNFQEYLKKIPSYDMAHQLHMFSKKLDRREALNNLEQVDFIISTEHFNEDIQILNKILNIELSTIHTRQISVKSNHAEDIEIEGFLHFEMEKNFYADAMRLRLLKLNNWVQRLNSK